MDWRSQFIIIRKLACKFIPLSSCWIDFMSVTNPVALSLLISSSSRSVEQDICIWIFRYIISLVVSSINSGSTSRVLTPMMLTFNSYMGTTHPWSLELINGLRGYISKLTTNASSVRASDPISLLMVNFTTQSQILPLALLSHCEVAWLHSG